MLGRESNRGGVCSTGMCQTGETSKAKIWLVTTSMNIGCRLDLKDVKRDSYRTHDFILVGEGTGPEPRHILVWCRKPLRESKAKTEEHRVSRDRLTAATGRAVIK